MTLYDKPSWAWSSNFYQEAREDGFQGIYPYRWWRGILFFGWRYAQKALFNEKNFDLKHKIGINGNRVARPRKPVSRG